MSKTIVLIAGCLATLSAIGLAHAQGKRPLRVVPEVDLARYAASGTRLPGFLTAFRNGAPEK